MISAQREMINISRPIIRFACYKKWEKEQNKKEKVEDRIEFDDEDNDYNRMMLNKMVLEEAELDMVGAEQSRIVADDYIVEKLGNEGKTLVLTPKYYEMLSGLEDTYENLYFLMVKYKIASTGLEEDELKSYKEQEEEAIRRVVEA
jgi:hypothetical protein